MKWQKALLGLLCAALLLGLTGCSEEDVNTALHLADALLNESGAFSEAEPDAEEAVPPVGEDTEEAASPVDGGADGSGWAAASGASSQSATVLPSPESWLDGQELDEEGTYSSQEDVAAYLVTYHHLPDNFITKAEARKLGWSGGSLEPYAPGKCIGGSRFGNSEGLLPRGEVYYECDINTMGAKKRGAERLVYCKYFEHIYYTSDHYKSFTLVYGAK